MFQIARCFEQHDEIPCPHLHPALDVTRPFTHRGASHLVALLVIRSAVKVSQCCV